MKEFTKLFLLLFANLTFAQQPEYEIFNTSINTEFAEFGVTYSNNNSVIFASSKKTKTEKRHNNRQLHLELYHGIITENGDIIESNKFSKEIKNKFYESDIAFTPDFKTIYFTWNNFYITQRKDSAKWKTLYMFKASINDSFEISNVTPLPFNNKEYSVRSPYVSPNGKQLFFISDMPSGYGGQDIYVVDILPNNEYSKPENLGPLVNTKKNELFPFIDTNNRLYFSSYGHKGLGFFMVAMDQPGVTIRPIEQLTGTSEFNEVFFTDARVPRDWVVGEVNDGWRAATGLLAHERSSLGKVGADAKREANVSAAVPFHYLLDIAIRTGHNTNFNTRQELMSAYIGEKVMSWTGQRKVHPSIGKLWRTKQARYVAAVGARMAMSGAAAHEMGDKDGEFWMYHILNAPRMSLGGGTDEIQKNTIGERALGLPREPS